MSLQRIYCESEEQQAIAHVCDPCGEKELGRVRGVGFIKGGFNVAALIASIKTGGTTATAAFEAAIEAGNIHLIPETTGTYNGGEPEYGDGYGDESQRLRSRNHELTFKDPSYAGNADFYAAIEKEHWIPMWRTETLLHFGDKPASVVATDPVEEDMNSDVTWNGTVNWKSKNKATIVPMGDLAKYFEGCWEPVVDPES